MNKQLTNPHLINLWTSQTQPKGKNKTLYFDGPSLYNSNNIELARIINNKTIFISGLCYFFIKYEYVDEIVQSLRKKNIEVVYVKSLTEYLENIDYHKTLIKDALDKVNSRSLNVNSSSCLLWLGVCVRRLFEYIKKMNIPLDTELTEWLHKIKNGCWIEKEVWINYESFTIRHKS